MTMKKRLTSTLMAAVMTASVLTSVPFVTHAEEEFLIRDKWGYCTSANYVTSEHFCIFYGNNDTTGKVNDEFLQRNLDDFEKIYDCYMEDLGMASPNVDIYGNSDTKYKVNVYLTYTGLDQYPDGWAFMSAEDGYGIHIISPEAMLDDLTIAHEFGHVVTMHQKAWVDQDISGAWWEPVANWFREMYLASEYYDGNVQTCWFEPYIRNLSLTIPHGRNYYEVWPLLVYMCYNPDNLEGLGMDSVTRLMSEALPNEYPFDTMTRIYGTDAQTILGHYAKRMATFDFGNQAAYQRQFNDKLASSPYYWKLFYTVLEEAEDGWQYVPQEEAPMQSGINIVPLNVTGDSISVSFKGLSNDPNAGWRASIVTVDAQGNETYSDLFGDGETMTVPANGAVSAYLTVTGTPDDFYEINAFHKENVSTYKDGTERRRYPYAVKIDGAEVQQTGGYAKAGGHAHSNGGGWVSDGATVADSVYVGPDAMVLGNANLSGNVRVEDNAIVANSVTAKDNVVISGNAVVDGGGMIYNNGWVWGTVNLSDNVVISDNAVVTNSCTISGNAKILQKAYLIEAVTVSENAVIKGMSYVYGTGNYSGQVIVDGDYANGEALTSGTAFGWLDTVNRNYTDGMISGYEFGTDTSTWASDKHGATNALQSGAVWEAERTSASGVLSFDGIDDYVTIDNSVAKTNNLQISLAALWKGGTAQQDLFWFGDENAYMAFTPSNENGVAEFTITNGTTTEKLTASAPLTKGEWSKVTIRLIDGTGTLLINGQQAASQSISLKPIDVMSASKDDSCYLGKSLSHNNFKGAVDYSNFYFKYAEEPTVTYSGSEAADDSDPVGSKVIGDVNVDGTFSVLDVVMLQKWLLNAGEITDCAAGDLHEDGIVDGFDLAVMKRILLVHRKR